jgi:hypothetical protein
MKSLTKISIHEGVIIICSITVQLLSGCSKQPDSNLLVTYDVESAIDSKNEPTFLDDICTEKKYIPLETTDELLIYGIHHIYMYDDRLYICHRCKCSVFDLDGRFLHHLGGIGNGPGEYQCAYKLSFTQDTIIIYYLNKLFYYNAKDETFIKSSTVPIFFESLSTCYDVFAGFSDPDNKNNLRLSFFSKSGTILHSIYHILPLFDAVQERDCATDTGNADSQIVATDNAFSDAVDGGYRNQRQQFEFHHADTYSAVSFFRGSSVGRFHPQLDNAACQYSHQHIAYIGLSCQVDASLRFFDSKKVGDIMQRIGDHRRIEAFMTG